MNEPEKDDQPTPAEVEWDRAIAEAGVPTEAQLREMTAPFHPDGVIAFHQLFWVMLRPELVGDLTHTFTIDGVDKPDEPPYRPRWDSAVDDEDDDDDDGCSYMGC